MATGANSVSMLLEGSLVECVGAGVIRVRRTPALHLPTSLPITSPKKPADLPGSMRTCMCSKRPR